MFRKHPYLTGFSLLFVLCLVLVTLINSAHKSGSDFWHDNLIGIIRVEGILMDSEPIVEKIRRMEKSDSVKGVILRINSPGGGVAVAQEIYDALSELRQTKPVYTSMGSVAASGGYYIAAATDRIFANSGTLTGSIGVLMEWVNLGELGQKVGAEMVTLKSGKNKNSISMFKKPAPDELVLIQSVVNDSHEQFVQAILQGRPGMDETKLRTLADGRIFTGKQAYQEQLVDELGSFQQVIDQMGTDLEISGEIQTLEFEDDDEYDITSLLGLSSVKKWMSNQQNTGVHLNYILQ
ncbi:MAG: signal peptide peptidase SppA [SAR324 cluster bacterium]|nr:signal peptide peptidase SppA [SAR324 cluster bacterium]